MKPVRIKSVRLRNRSRGPVEGAWYWTGVVRENGEEVWATFEWTKTIRGPARRLVAEIWTRIELAD